jgi:hypothetical protein
MDSAGTCGLPQADERNQSKEYQTEIDWDKVETQKDPGIIRLEHG